jgi:hypothetical protein
MLAEKLVNIRSVFTAADRWKAVSASIDMDAVGPIPALPKA